MSVQMSNTKTINQAIKAVLILERESRSSLTYRIIQNFGDDREDNLQKLGEKMIELNALSYACRYNNDTVVCDPDYKFSYEDCTKIQAFKSLSYFTYQCSEPITEGNELFENLCKVETRLAMSIVHELEEWKSADWGSK